MSSPHISVRKDCGQHKLGGYLRGVVGVRHPSDRESQHESDAVHAAGTARLHGLSVHLRPGGRWLPAAAYQPAGGLAFSPSRSGYESACARLPIDRSPAAFFRSHQLRWILTRSLIERQMH